VKRFKNILVVPAQLSAEDAALQRAAALALGNGARVTAAWPVEDLPAGELPAGVQDHLLAGMEGDLRVACEPLRAKGIEVETVVMQGRPFIRIIQRVLARGHDVVIKTARGRQLYHSLFFGTTALHLLRKCPCPVWIVDPNPPAATGAVMAAIDPDGEDDAERAVATTLMELATSLAIVDQVPLHVLHVWEAPYESTLRHSPRLRVSPAEVDAYVGAIEARHRQRLGRLIGPFLSVAPDMRVEMIKGNAAEVITEEARVRQISTIVMATLARDGVPGLLIGNTAEAVLGRVECSVLTIKPRGFISPVRDGG
jgi:nucleotide-binding universal stress UspA family protein